MVLAVAMGSAVAIVSVVIASVLVIEVAPAIAVAESAIELDQLR